MWVAAETAAQAAAVAGLLVLIAYSAWTQRREGHIRNVDVGPAAVLAIVAAPLVWDDWVAHLAAGAVCFAVLLTLELLRPAAIGMGVVKLLAVVALVLGPAAWLAVAVAAVTGAAHAWLCRPGPIDGPPHVMAGVVVALVVGLA